MIPALALLAQASGAVLLILILVRFRTRFGLMPLYLTVGAFQYAQVVLANTMWIELFPGMPVSPGSVVLFAATLFAILVVYLIRDAAEARKLCYGLLATNLTIATVSCLSGAALGSAGTDNVYHLPTEYFVQDVRIMLIGSITLALDVALLIVAYEAIARRVGSLFLRVALTMSIVLIFDTLLFAIGSFFERANFTAILAAGITGKTLAAFFYAGALSCYLRVSEPGGLGSLAPPRSRLRVDVDEMLQICASCKQVRDAATGKWEPIEAHLWRHAGIRFSHGICPVCVTEHYAECAEPPADPDQRPGVS